MHLRAFHFLLVSNFIVSFWSAPAFSQAKTNSDDVISWIEKNGGEFDRDQSRIEKPIIKLRLDRTRGIDPGFYRDTLEDAGLQRLAELPELEQLNLENRTTFTDKGLLYLASLKNLRSLNLSRTSINGFGLNHLTKLMQLTELDLSACHRLNDESMGHLKRLQQLTSIRLDATSSRWVSDSIWSSELLRAANLGASPAYYGMSELDELRGGISDDGLRQILGMRNLQTLAIGTTRITDAGTRELQQFAQPQNTFR